MLRVTTNLWTDAPLAINISPSLVYEWSWFNMFVRSKNLKQSAVTAILTHDVQQSNAI